MVEAQNTVGTISIVTSPVHSGSYALRINPSAATGNYNLRGYTADGNGAAFGLATIYLSFYLRLGAIPGSTVFVCYGGDGTNPIAALQIDSTGQISIDAAAGDSAAAATLVIDTWYRIDFKIVQNGTCELQVNGGTAVTATGANLVINQVRLGVGTQTKDFYYDDVVVDDAAFPVGAHSIVRMDANADGVVADWTRNTGSNDWEAVDEIPHDSDTTYIGSSLLTQASTVALESAASAGIAGAVKAVKSLTVIRDETVASSISTRLRSASTNDDTTGRDPGNVYVANAKIYVTDPATAAAWLLAALDSIEVGVLNNLSVGVRCTLACAMVLFINPIPRVVYNDRRRRV